VVTLLKDYSENPDIEGRKMICSYMDLSKLVRLGPIAGAYSIGDEPHGSITLVRQSLRPVVG
jgi:hypothetical protein